MTCDQKMNWLALKPEMSQAMASIQEKLQSSFAEAQVRNPSYTMRSYARRLGVSHGALSEILRGKRKISKKMAERLLTKLNIPPWEKDQILAQHTSTTKRVPYTVLDMNQYELISNWYHFAILSLAETKSFQSNTNWIAKRLGITPSTAKQTVNRLLQLKLLSEDKDGSWRPTGIQYETSDNIVSLALRKSHSRNLELARSSLESDTIEIRDFTALTLSISQNQISQAKKIIREFEDRFEKEISENSSHKEEVYKLCVQFFPLTKIKSKKQNRSKSS